MPRLDPTTTMSGYHLSIHWLLLSVFCLWDVSATSSGKVHLLLIILLRTSFNNLQSTMVLYQWTNPRFDRMHHRGHSPEHSSPYRCHASHFPRCEHTVELHDCLQRACTYEISLSCQLLALHLDIAHFWVRPGSFQGIHPIHICWVERVSHRFLPYFKITPPLFPRTSADTHSPPQRILSYDCC